ncbi:glycosyltransferase family 25 protein [Rhodobacter maris]|uniref:Glycosyl transferase family 25 n=1 Tax=Rhodobacter maris TaxID=446682 RepID=A0A285SG88_9RHOB|nr:glycosyltransferase family 25 protein [Rhodobacter maris]SOC06886.1 glycosyl transferase family 25 [Rhodobacter maris]
MIPSGLFNEILVVSLPQSSDRRDHIRSHFAEVGITAYRFFDASGPEDPEVTALFEDDKVAGYPPCFRCGKLECGRPDCNNVLTPQQVAVFVTYLRLWRHVSAGGGRVLVCEDDVLFHPWAGQVLNRLQVEIARGDLSFSGSAPRLFRLGWALGPDHDAEMPFRVDDTLRMSNPCHALTAAYARDLLACFDRVVHTADVFQHQLAPISQTAARTVFPPIASELSWSVGTLESLIHPKDRHADWLEAQGRGEEAARYREKIAQHFRDTAHKTPS